MGRIRTNTTSDLVREPPDSGWAWMVMVGSCTVQLTVIGFLASMAVYVYVWIDFFDGSAAETSLTISLCSFMMGFLSPVAGSVCKRFGPRLTAMAGGVLICAGVLASSQATDIVYLIMSLGLVTAFGMSMTVNASFACLGKYFKKRLALAMGIATAGTSLGQLALPPLFQYLIDQYGWRGSMMITAAISFHAVAAGALFRPLAPKKPKRSSRKRKGRELELKTPVDNKGTNKDCETTEASSLHGLSFLNLSVFGRENLSVSRGDFTLGEGSLGEPDIFKTAGLAEDEDRIEYVDSDTWSSTTTSEEDISAMSNNVWVPVVVATMENYKGAGRHESFIPWRPRSASMLSQTLLKKSSELSRLVRNLSFLVMLLVATAHGFGWASTTYHLVSRAESINIEPDNAALLLTLMGAGSFIGRLGIGWIVDRGYLRPEICYTLALTVCALATFITPLVVEFEALVAVALVHGLSSGAATVIIVMTPRLVVKASLATTSTAYFFLAWGVGEISGGILAGWFYDALESYDYSFYTAGSVMTTGAGLMLVIYFLQRAKRRRHGYYGKTSGEKGGWVESGSNKLDPELAGSGVDDVGRANPVFFMRERFQLENDRCEQRDENVGRWNGGVIDLKGQSWVSPTDKAGDNGEGGVLRAIAQRAGETLGEDCGDVAESLGFENQIYGNDLAAKAYSNNEMAGQTCTDAEVHERSADESEEATTNNAADPVPEFPDGMTVDNSDEKTMSSDESESDGERDMGVENPWCVGASYSSIHRSDYMDKTVRSEMPSCDGVETQADTRNAISDISSDDEHYGIENPIYSMTEYSPYNTEYERGERGSSNVDGWPESDIANEEESGISNPGYFGFSQIAQYSVVNPKPGRDCVKAEKEDSSNDSVGEKSDLGISNPCYTASSPSSDDCCTENPKSVSGSCEENEVESDRRNQKNQEREVVNDTGAWSKQVDTEEIFL